MTFNFLMCLGYVPNDGKETVNFMILECVMVYFFQFVLPWWHVSQPCCYKHVLGMWNHLPLDRQTFYFSARDRSVTETCELGYLEQIIQGC